MKNYFPYKEFIECSNVPNSRILTPKESKSMEFWQNTFNPLRDIANFPVSLTNWLRVYKGENSRSQHFANETWSEVGAIDSRPTRGNNKDHFVTWALLLMAHPNIKRVCWYEPSDRFGYGGFHCDGKGDEKMFYINSGSKIDWQVCDEAEMIESIFMTK